MKRSIVDATPLIARVVAIIDLRREDRGLCFAPWTSRAIRAGEIHELIATDEPSSGKTVDAVSYLAFVEFTQGGILLIGSMLRRRNEIIGRLRGFDETHMPNHMNIVIQTMHRATGVDLGWRIGDCIDFLFPTQDANA